MLEVLQIFEHFANLKKSFIHKNKICFLDYVILIQKVGIRNMKIEAIQN